MEWLLLLGIVALFGKKKPVGEIVAAGPSTGPAPIFNMTVESGVLPSTTQVPVSSAVPASLAVNAANVMAKIQEFVSKLQAAIQGFPGLMVGAAGHPPDTRGFTTTYYVSTTSAANRELFAWIHLKHSTFFTDFSRAWDDFMHRAINAQKYTDYMLAANEIQPYGVEIVSYLDKIKGYEAEMHNDLYSAIETEYKAVAAQFEQTKLTLTALEAQIVEYDRQTVVYTYNMNQMLASYAGMPDYISAGGSFQIPNVEKQQLSVQINEIRYTTLVQISQLRAQAVINVTDLKAQLTAINDHLNALAAQLPH